MALGRAALWFGGGVMALDLASAVIRSADDLALFAVCLSATAAAHLATAAAFARMQRRALEDRSRR